MTATDATARQFVITALDGRAEQYDVDRIVAACHDVADGWHFEHIDPQIFWTIVSECAR